MERSALALSFRAPAESAPVDWMISPGLVDYQAALACMDARVAAIAAGKSPECIWLLEHSSIYTAGTSAQDDELLASTLPVFRTGRGGRYTYHGPGQRIAYVMLDLKRRKPDVRAFVAALEDWIIATLADFGIFGERRQDRVGVWVRRPGDLGMSREDKIAALGIRLRHWVSFHGISINITPDLTYFQGIVPCGISSTDFGVTSFTDLGFATSLPEVDGALRRNFERIFGPTKDVEDRDR